MSGSVEVMKWLCEQGIVFNTTVMEQAAKFGRLALCQYLSAEGCPFPPPTARVP
jgi:hypothetical protein